MPRFFFDVLRERDYIRRDIGGLDVPDLDSAEIEAVELWKRLRSECQAAGQDPSHWVVQVSDETGTLLANMPSSLQPWRISPPV